ncbi:MAG: hypothetical protein Q4F72_01815, partial [Desulfovibrionaceae bacterium]|nr:hypothetical protein [Desulfovibrionaceae bacterium]
MNNAYKRTVWLMGIRVTANVLTLGALCVAMYMSYLHPSEALLTFCQWFFGITLATWYVCRKLGQYVRRTLADQDEGLVRLPGHRKAAVMKWKI